MSLGRILVIDDESQIAMARVLMSLGYESTCVPDGVQGLRRVASYRPDVVLLDCRLPGMTGLDVLAVLRRQHPELPVVLVSADDDPRTAAKALELGAVDYLHKPVDVAVLRQALQAAMIHRER
jgi:CheY-like chemotaxis protein